MREIIFRGKRTDNDEGKFVYGIPVEGEPLLGMGKCTYIITKPGVQWVDGVYMTYDECIEVDPETVCQFTGLTDKNGRKIFEGDILQCNNNPQDLVKAVFGKFDVIDMETETAVDNVIGWHYEVIPTDPLSKVEPFCLPMPLTEFYINRCSMVVIGNIYDNPELLEVKQNG